MSKIVSLDDAEAKGLARYFTGIPCKHGHVSERYVVNNGCLECVKIRQRMYRQLPGAKEKNAARRRQYYLENLEEQKEYNKKYAKEYRKKHFDELREYDRRRYHYGARRESQKTWRRKVYNMIFVLRKTMPEFIKEFGL